jgi:hypothetical protein
LKTSSEEDIHKKLEHIFEDVRECDGTLSNNSSISGEFGYEDLGYKNGCNFKSPTTRKKRREDDDCEESEEFVPLQKDTLISKDPYKVKTPN